MPNAASPQRLSNFGANLQFQPGLLVQPRTEEELLSVLRENQGKRCRAIGRLHSWSEVVVGDEIVVDTRNLQHVIVHDEGEQSWAEVGAGCQIKHLLVELERQGGFTVPALGLITEQTVAGAAATGTHGSGRHSLSHYLQAVRLIVTDPVTGEFTVRTIREDRKSVV